MSHYSLFKAKRFLPLFLTQFQGALTDNLVKNTLITIATWGGVSSFSSLDSSTIVYLAAALLMLPFFLFSGLSGQIAEKFDKAIVIRFVKGFEIFSLCLAIYGFHTQNIGLLLTTVFLLGLHSTFFGTVKFSILPEYLKDKEIMAGNAFIEGGTFISILIGSILGAQLPGYFGSASLFAGGTIVACIGLSLSIVGFITSFFLPNTTPVNPSLRISPRILKSSIDVVKDSTQNWRVFRAIFGISWFWLIAMAFMTLLPDFVKEVLKGNPGVYTLFLVVFSIGIAIGSILCERAQRAFLDTRYVPVGALLMTFFMMMIFLLTKALPVGIEGGQLLSIGAFLSSFINVLILASVFFFSLFSGFYIVPLNTMIQVWTERERLSRVIAANNILNALFMVLGAISLIIFSIMGISLPYVMLLLAVCNFGVAIYICKILPSAVVRVALEWLFKLLYNVKVEGLDNYEKAGDRVLIVANHTSFLDGILLGVFLHHKTVFPINTAFSKKWWVKIFDSMVDFYPLDPTNPSSTRALINEIKKDKHCVIFPEGRLTVTGALMKVYEGSGMIADKSDAKILPVRIDGAIYTPFSRMKGRFFTRMFPQITIKILPHREFDLDPDLTNREKRTESANHLYKMMTDMMFDSSHEVQDKLFTSLINAKKITNKKHIAIEDVNRKPLTYKKLIMGSFVLGNHINANNPDDKNIGVLLPSMSTTVVLFMSMQAYGKTPVLLNFSAGASNICHSCKISNTKTVYTSKLFIEKAALESVVEALIKDGVKVVYLEDDAKKIGLKTKAKGIFFSYFPKISFDFITRKVTPDCPAVVLFTSGSEGKPKGVALSHANLQANRFQIGAKIDFNENDVVFNCLPLFHSFGLTGGCLLPLLSGVKVFLYPSPLHYKIVAELVYDTDSTVLFGTDTFLSNYGKVAHPFDFYSIRHIFAGAEKLKASTQELWNHKFGIRIYEGYGATETSPIISVNTPMECLIGSVGKLLPRIEYKLEPIPGIEEGGQLHVKAPNVMLGYYLENNPGQIQPVVDGWYDTGDIVKIDKQGFVHILGRVKRFAKIAGEMISLSQVEMEISKLSPQKNHAISSVVDEKKGEKLVLVTEDAELDRLSILKYFKANGLSELAVPKEVMVVAEVPMLGTGKIDYKSVAKLVAENF